MVKLLTKAKKIKDSDGDGLSDFDEINIFGSDPFNADSDGDGLEDGEAVLNGKDPVGGGSLKDFFIPHAGNNYKPKSLHPKRLLFHAASVLVVKLMLFLLIFFYPITAWMTPDVSAEEGHKIIALTNTLRKSLALNPLTENQKLNQAAAQKVEDMFINQYFAHLSPQNHDLEYFLKLASYKNYVTVGENLAMGYDTASEAMDAWKNSPTHYSNLVDPNFNEIGVALAGGSYLEKDTIFGAQYFGLAQTETTPVIPKTVITKAVDPTFKAGEKAVLAEKTDNKVIIPILAAKEAKITIDKPAGAKADKIIKVEATLPAKTATANLEILNNNIVMAPVVTATSTDNEAGKWVGQAVIQDNSKSVTPPIITLSTNNGEIQKVEVSNNNITPQATSLVNQYWLFKTHPDNNLEKIFDISSIYFKIILGLVILAMILNIFIQIKKQHPKVIFSGLGLVVFLLIMIIF